MAKTFVAPEFADAWWFGELPRLTVVVDTSLRVDAATADARQCERVAVRASRAKAA